MADVKLFLSCVSDEFGDYRDALRSALTRLNVDVKIQEEFQNRGGDTLAMLEDYIESCDVVVHFAGEMAASSGVGEPSASPTRTWGSAGRKGHGSGGARALDLYPMGSLARDRLQQGRRRTQSRNRNARLWRETRRKIRANGLW